MKRSAMSHLEIAMSVGAHPLSFSLRRSEARGLIMRAGLTPTDVLHAEGSYVRYDAEASKLGVELMARQVGLTPAGLISEVKRMVEEKIAMELLRKLLEESIGPTSWEAAARFMASNGVSGSGRQDLAVDLRSLTPIIGIGAPVGAYLPGVARIFHCPLALPEHSEIGNALGAVSGNVIESVEALIRPRKGAEMQDDPLCTLFWSQGRQDFESVTAAVEHVRIEGGRIAREKAIASGAQDVEVIVEQDRREARLDGGRAGTSLLDVTVTVTAIGKPKLFVEK